MKTLMMVMVLAVSLTACGGDSSSGDTELLGQELFEEMVVGGKAGCTSCHSVEPGQDGVGPSLAGIGTLAGSRVAGVSAADYLRESITDPNSYVVDGYNTGVMPGGWDLSDAQIDSLVDYLLDL